MPKDTDFNFLGGNPRNLSETYWAIATKQAFGAKTPVEVFNTSIGLPVLIEKADMRLVSQLDAEKRWGMNRIIQRNITPQRVEEIKKRFLKAEDRSVKYFPGITVALLPFDDFGPISEYKKGTGYKNIEGLFLYLPQTDVLTDENLDNWQGWNFPYQLQWDKELITAVVIDGQHRVQALKDSFSNSALQEVRDESIPASFVLLNRNEAVTATRQIFIDVNNTPKTVSEQRLIFIDDRNIFRRMTSNSLGATLLNSEKEDPYVQFRENNKIVPDLLAGKINNLYVGGQTSDDATDSSIYFSHDSLFPWEFTHILTLHEHIHKKIILSDPSIPTEFGAGPDLTVIAKCVNKPLTINTQREAKKSDDPTSALADIKHSIKSSDRETAQGKQLLLKFVDLHESFSGALADDDEDDGHKEAVAFALSEALREADNFSFPCEITDHLISTELGELASFATVLITKLSMYTQLDLAASDDSHVARSIKLRFIETMRGFRGDVKKEHVRKPKVLVEKFLKIEDCHYESDVQRGLVSWLEYLRESNEVSGLLRYLVGQQGLFLWAVRAANEQKGSCNLRYAELAADRVNRWREMGLFKRSREVLLPWPLDEYSISPLEGTVIEGTAGKADSVGDNGKIKTGRLNAMRLADLLLFLDKGVTSFENSISVPPGFNFKNSFGSLKRAMGRSVLESFIDDGWSLGKLRDKLLNESLVFDLQKPKVREAFYVKWEEQTEYNQKACLQHALGGITYNAIREKFSYV